MAAFKILGRNACFAGFFRVTHDGLCERGTTRSYSLCFQQRGLLDVEDTGQVAAQQTHRFYCFPPSFVLLSFIVVRAYVNCTSSTPSDSRKGLNKKDGRGEVRSLIVLSATLLGTLNTERTYKWKLSGSARQSEIGILCFDWLIHPGVSYSREI